MTKQQGTNDALQHTMQHRHIVTGEYTLTAIDDVIERGLLRDWLELRDAVRSSADLARDVKHVCEHQKPRSDFPSRYVFWSNLLERMKQGALHV